MKLLSDKKSLPRILPSILAGVGAFFLYYFSSAPSISWAHDSQDSGEFAACAATLGITHPTGYPFYILLGHLLIKLFSLDPGRAMVLLSVFAGAMGVGITVRAVQIAVEIYGEGRVGSGISGGWWGLIAAGFVMINPVIWSQAVVCEVYSFAFMLQVIAWLVLVKIIYECEKGDAKSAMGLVSALGLVLGLIAAHHVPGLSILLPVTIILIYYLRKNALKAAGNLVAGMIPGLLLYIYLPIRSMQNPKLDWGNPETFRNFVDHVTANQYHNLLFGAGFDQTVQRMESYLRGDNWGVLGLILCVAGLVALIRERGSKGKILGSATLIFILWIYVFASGYRVTDYEVFYYPMFAPMAILIGIGLWAVAGMLGRVSKYLVWVLFLVTVVTIGIDGHNRWQDNDLSDPMLDSAVQFAYRNLREMPPDALIITGSDGTLFSLMYAVNCGISMPSQSEILGPRDDLEVVASTWLLRDWFVENMWNRLQYERPSWNLEECVKALIDENIEERPVFIGPEVLAEYPALREEYIFTSVHGLLEVTMK